ncbi:MAG TPA: AbrB/MazE/SpoVT family DNA-binding domain-containing protein [Candidatus Limnocylindrales bacterium]|nr:AbrB/MazE/SpoVT family DNA-binding domain-containing protein [Candidatus Limnocylindrales bacterium]
MEAAARVTCKGQITIPKAIRDALGVEDGDHVVFRVEGDRAIFAKTSNLLDMAGVLSSPAPTRGTQWDEVEARARASRGRSNAADFRAGIRSPGAKIAAAHAPRATPSRSRGARADRKSASPAAGDRP